jgi:transposase
MDIQIGDNVPRRINMNKKQLPSKREITPTSPESTAGSRTTYSDEFKRNAVARLRSGGQNATDLADELGIRRNQLYKWAKKFDEQGPNEAFRAPGRPPLDELNEVERLRRELAKAQEELAILKKFDAYLTRLKK